MGRQSSPRSVHGSRGRSPPRRRSGGDRGRKEHGSVSLLVRNIPLNCSNQTLRVAFEKFGPIRDVYMPRLYHSQQPRGFAFLEFADASDASEALLHMNNHMLDGHKITVVVAVESRKRPEEMRRRVSARRNPDHEDRKTSRYGQSRSRTRSPRYGGRAKRSRSHTCSPRYGGPARSRSHSPAPKRRDGDSASPKRKEGHQEKSSTQSKEHDKDKKQHSCTPDNRNDCHDVDNDSNEREATPDYSAPLKRKEECQTKSPRQSKEYDNYRKQRSYTPEDRNEFNDHSVADNGSKEGLATSTTDVEGSRPRRRSPRQSSGSCSRRRDDSSTSPKRNEEGLAKSPRQSKEYDGDKKMMSYAPDYRNDRSCKSPRPSSASRTSRRDDYTASPKRKEERPTKSPRQSKGRDRDKKRMQYVTVNRNDCRDADSGHHEKPDDYSASAKTKEEGQAKSPRLSKECDKDKNQRSYIPDNRNDHRDADNRSKGNRSPARRDGEGSDARQRSPRPSSVSRSRRQDDYSALVKTKEGCRAKSPRQSKGFDGDKKRRSYGLDDRNDCHDADSAYNEMRDDHSAYPSRKEDSQAKAPRQSNEHDEDKKKRSYDDRNDRHDADNGCNERRETPDCSASSKRKEEPHQTESRKRSKEDEKSVKRIPDDRNTSRDAGHGSKEKPATAVRDESCSRPRNKLPRPPAE